MAVIDASSGTIQAFVIDHRLRACRADGQSMTETDWSNVYQHFQSLPEPPAAAVPVPVPPRISAATTQPKPPHCEHCRQESGAPRNRTKLRLIKTEFDDDGALMRRSVETASAETPEWRRNGKIIWRTWPDGRPGEWACHYCGRIAG
jgi:hypothetical protein